MGFYILFAVPQLLHAVHYDTNAVLVQLEVLLSREKRGDKIVNGTGSLRSTLPFFIGDRIRGIRVRHVLQSPREALWSLGNCDRRRYRWKQRFFFQRATSARESAWNGFFFLQ